MGGKFEVLAAVLIKMKSSGMRIFSVSRRHHETSLTFSQDVNAYYPIRLESLPTPFENLKHRKENVVREKL